MRVPNQEVIDLAGAQVEPAALADRGGDLMMRVSDTLEGEFPILLGARRQCLGFAGDRVYLTAGRAHRLDHARLDEAS